MRLSVQLYTLRDALSQDVLGTLSELQSLGLEYVEVAGYYDRSAEEWKQLLDERGLKVSGNHVGLDAMKADLALAIEQNKTLGNPNVILPWIGESTYSAGWDVFGNSVEPYASQLKEAGLRFLYHNHAFEFEGDGLTKFYASTNPELVYAELDLAWVKIGGANPAEWVKTMGKRAPLLHLKDYDPTKTPQWTPAGEGILDFDDILAAAHEAGTEFGVIELDESPGSPLEAVRKSFEFFKSKGLS